jgi:hypothetical protein
VDAEGSMGGGGVGSAILGRVIQVEGQVTVYMGE